MSIMYFFVLIHICYTSVVDVEIKFMCLYVDEGEIGSNLWLTTNLERLVL